MTPTKADDVMNCCVEVAHRSEYGAAASCAQLRHQRPPHPVLRAHQRVSSVPIRHTPAPLPASVTGEGQSVSS